jgi:hypothetical protein
MQGLTSVPFHSQFCLSLRANGLWDARATAENFSAEGFFTNQWRHHFLTAGSAKPINTTLASMTQEKISTARTVIESHDYISVLSKKV